MSSGYSVAVVGATGAVGSEFLRLFDERNFPIRSLQLFASERSAGKSISFQGQPHRVETAHAGSFKGTDVAFFSAGAARSRELAPAAMEQGALVIDNSSAFRMDPSVPLVIPEVNVGVITPNNRLISVPNCCAIILVVAVNPLRKLGHIERLIVSTYQSASGGGAAMMQLLEEETKALILGSEPPKSSLSTRYAFNLFSHNTPINDQGYNEEEAKVIFETRKILAMPELKVNATCVRVPVLRAHTESITVEYASTAPSVDDVRSIMSRAPGIKLVDDRDANRFPTPLEASGQGDVLVGRFRQDLSNPNAICMLVSGDQLLKGAALNAVQIAEHVFAMNHA